MVARSLAARLGPRFEKVPCGGRHALAFIRERSLSAAILEAGSDRSGSPKTGGVTWR
jgi:hypothetical protein